MVAQCDLLTMILFIHSFIHSSTCYSAPSRFLLRGAPDYSADTESEFHAEAHEQLRVKDLPRVPTRLLEVDSNPQHSGCKAPNIPLHHRATHLYIYSLSQTDKQTDRRTDRQRQTDSQTDKWTDTLTEI